MRNFAALLLGFLLVAMQLVIVQAAPEDSGAMLLDKFPSQTEVSDDYSFEWAITDNSDAIQIDKFTGEELDESTSSVGGNLILINQSVIYDREKRAFVHSTSREQIYSNVASGMTTTESVWLIVPEGITFHLYKDGKLIDDVDYSNISEPGAYTLTGDEVIDNTEIMHFTIVSPVTGQLSRFQVPDGFLISSALCNGSKIAAERTYVDMTTEGDYDIAYRCPVTETMHLFRVTVDHTPPVLALAEVREDGTAKGPVNISDLEEGAQIGIWLNNKEIHYEETLTRNGRYTIVVTDEAGNMNTYAFTIRVYYNTNSVIFFIAIIAVGIGVGIYALYSRRHMRIR